MSQMNKPEMSVVRFAENDVIVASGNERRIVPQSFDLTGCTGTVVGDGTVTYNNVVYTLDSTANVDSFIAAIGADGIRNAGIQSGSKPGSLRHTLNYEVTTGTQYYKDGTYVYDPSATWTNSNGTTLKGVFIRQ